jgi:RNA polymerase sigma factor (TIGR02999 family)
MSEVTQLLTAIGKGDSAAASRLFPVVYDELRRLARSHMAHERAGHTLQPTALVHEAYLRLIGDAKPRWDGHGHFFAAAAEAMRRILIERARQKAAIKHGGELQRIDLAEHLAVDIRAPNDLLALDEALVELESNDAAAAQLVKLRYFAGLSHQEAAAAMQISRRQADRLWALAKAWLFKRLAKV